MSIFRARRLKGERGKAILQSDRIAENARARPGAASREKDWKKMRAKWLTILLIAAAAAPLTACLTVAFDSTGPAKLPKSQIRPGSVCAVYYIPVSPEDSGVAHGVLSREDKGWIVLRDAEGQERWIRETQIKRIDYNP